MNEELQGELQIKINELRKQVKPSKAAQEIRARLSVAFDSEKSKHQWLSDHMHDYVWDLIDIAAQWGIDHATPREMSWEEFKERFPRKDPSPELLFAAKKLCEIIGK